MAALFADENIRSQLVTELRLLGHSVQVATEVLGPRRGMPDDEVVRYAVERGRVVLTYNRHDYARLHRQDRNHDGIVVCTEDDDWTLARRIHAALRDHAPLAGKLIRVCRPPVGTAVEV